MQLRYRNMWIPSHFQSPEHTFRSCMLHWTKSFSNHAIIVMWLRQTPSCSHHLVSSRDIVMVASCECDRHITAHGTHARPFNQVGAMSSSCYQHRYFEWHIMRIIILWVRETQASYHLLSSTDRALCSHHLVTTIDTHSHASIMLASFYHHSVNSRDTVTPTHAPRGEIQKSHFQPSVKKTHEKRR